MPLSTAKPVLKMALRKSLKKLDPKNLEGKQNQSKILEDLADEITEAVDAYVKSAVVAPGIPLVAGVLPGATTGPGTLI